MNNRLKNPVIWIPLLVAASFVGGMFAMKGLYGSDGRDDARRKFATVLGIIDNEYVDDVDIDSLLEATYPDLLAGLDPHSVYIPAEDLEAVNSELEGSFSGIGISFNMLNDTVNVLEVISGGPSQKVGLMAGDRIVTIDDSVASGRKWTNERVMSTLRGEEGSTVRLGVKRGTAPKLLEFEVTRGPIPVTSVDAAYLIDPETGFIRINKFGSNTYDEFFSSIVNLRSKGAKRYILDLRGNTGGYMEMAIMMANEFLPAHRLIVSTKGRSADSESRAVSDGNGTFADEEVVVLLDEFSASASEILAGALQDQDRGLVVGRRSFGKGLVQRQMGLPDGSAVRLTIARYYTPSGRCIQKVYRRGEGAEYENDLVERFNRGEAYSADSIHMDENLIFSTLSGRKVYGGGGIMPDIFVPNDTAAITSYYLNVLNAGLLQRFAFQWADSHRASLSKAPDTPSLLRQLPDDDALLQEIAAFAAANGVPARWYYINISRPLLVNDLKALIARDILGASAYYEVANASDPTVQRALQALRDGEAHTPVKTQRGK